LTTAPDNHHCQEKDEPHLCSRHSHVIEDSKLNYSPTREKDLPIP